MKEKSIKKDILGQELNIGDIVAVSADFHGGGLRIAKISRFTPKKVEIQNEKKYIDLVYPVDTIKINENTEQALTFYLLTFSL